MKSIFITGGSSGIGMAAVKEFSKLGYKVAFTYKQNKKVAEELAGKTGAICIPWSATESMEDAYKTAKTLLGITGFDVFFSSAGINLNGVYGFEGEEAVKDLWEVNYFSVRRGLMQLLPYMISQKRGSIILTSSMWGQVGGSCEVEYSATKGAIIAMTKALAKELAPSGIRVNCIAPGFVDTPMNGHLTEEIVEQICQEIPMERAGVAEEIAKTIAFLASDSSSYITGQIIGVNGGLVV